MDFQEFKEKYQKIRPEEVANSTASEPMVSICVQTYQHANFIKDCLDGILKQETSFPFELLLGEDGSTDGTREICLEYAEKYPDKIRLFLHHRENNIKIDGRPTGRFNFLYNMFAARGKYIALCEGDDYWTDPLKLQKQVDFLENEDDYGLCLHKVREINGFSSKQRVIPDNEGDIDFSIEEYILDNKTATCSMLFRKEKLGNIPSWFTEVPFGDLGLILLILENTNKKARVLKDVMGVYNIHEGGIHGKLQKNHLELIKAYRQHILFNKMISKFFFQEKYKKVIIQKNINIYTILVNLYQKNNMLYKQCYAQVWKKYFELVLKKNN